MNFYNLELKNLTKKQLFLVFSYSACWLSISTDFNDMYPLSYIEYKIFNNLSFSHMINFLRQSLNILIFPILLYLFIKKINHIKIKKDLIFFSFFFYFLLQIPGLIFYQNSLMNFVYIMSAINILIILQLSNFYFNKDNYIIFAFISFLMLLLITILNYNTFINFIKFDSRSLYTFFTSSETFLGKDSPRSTGSSRTFLLIFLISLMIFLNFLKRKVVLKNTLFITIATIILLFQSRTTIVLLIVFIILNYRYENPVKIKDKLKYLFIYFACPVIFLYFILVVKNISIVKENLNLIFDNSGSITTFNILKEDFQRPIDPETYSSGRYEDWNNLYHKIKKSPIIGYGSQGDRFSIDQTASNGALYALSSSGILGFSFYCILTIYSLILIFQKFIFLNKKNTKGYICSIIIFIIILRSILESSYSVFGVDFIIFSSFIFYLNKLNQKNEY